MRRMRCYGQIAAFLAEFMIERKTYFLPTHPYAIAEVIRALITEGVTTREELQQEALRRYDVIIGSDLFPHGEEDAR